MEKCVRSVCIQFACICDGMCMASINTGRKYRFCSLICLVSSFSHAFATKWNKELLVRFSWEWNVKSTNISMHYGKCRRIEIETREKKILKNNEQLIGYEDGKFCHLKIVCCYKCVRLHSQTNPTIDWCEMCAFNDKIEEFVIIRRSTKKVYYDYQLDVGWHFVCLDWFGFCLNSTA